MNLPADPGKRPAHLNKESESLSLKMVAIALVAIIGVIVVTSAIRIPMVLTANDTLRHTPSQPAAAASGSASAPAATAPAPAAPAGKDSQ